MYIYAVVCKVDGPSPVLATLDLDVWEVGRVVSIFHTCQA